MERELADLLDREAIRATLAALARGEDRRDAALLEASFWPEATLDFGVFQGSLAEYLAWVVPGAEAIVDTQHVLGQSHVALDGDTARVETQVISYHRVAPGDGPERDTCIGGRYLDVLEKRGGAWRVRERTMLYDWSQDWGEAADWSTGVMGQGFAAPRYAGRARGDWSERFFAR